MSRLTREQLKQFGSSGAISFYGKFGSKAAGSPVNTKDLDTIQALSAWEAGLQDACIIAADGSKAPFLEDINSLHYVHSYQQAYMFQEGIPEWEATRAYYIGSVVKKIHLTDGGSVNLYCSMMNNNINTPLPISTDPNWARLIGLEAGNVVLDRGNYISFDLNYENRIYSPSTGRLKIKAGNTEVLDLDVNAGTCYLKGKPWEVLNKNFTINGGTLTVSGLATLTGGITTPASGYFGSGVNLPDGADITFDSGVGDTEIQSGGGVLGMKVDGSRAVEMDASNIYLQLPTQCYDIDPFFAGNHDLGSASKYWREINYKTLTDRGCLGCFDDGVELANGEVVSDLEAIAQIKKHKTKKTIYKKPMLDYKTFPKVAYHKAKVNGKLLKRNSKDDPIGGADGVEMTSMFSIFIGAFKEVSNRLQALEVK